MAGGAIYNEAGTLNISVGASFTSNQAEYGGAIYAFNGTTTLSSASFMNNTATTDTTTGAYYNGNSGFSSQYVDYLGNTCGGPNPVIDNGGNTRDVASVGCPGSLPTVTLSASAVCIGADLQVTISAGDPNFQITADSGTLLTGLSVGTHTITGPLTETNVNVTELGGNTENFPLGNFSCFVSNTLSATAVCVGADLHVTITNGNAPFTVNVTNTSGVMSMGSVALGTYTFTGPDTFANIKVIEESGDLETLSLAGVTCAGSLVLSPTVVLSPDTTALGCTLTADVEAFGMTDNTYCRLLMKNGGVIKFPGAVPQNLINLGVILAVDVYRLQGGQSITDFGGYSRVCLAGEGRLFYLDARTSPRAQVELATESLDGMTCGWIPAAGTLVLTN